MARNIAQKLHGNSDEQTSTVELRVLWLLLVCRILKDTLLRSVNPRVDDVEVTNDFVRYHLAGTTYDVRIFFKDVQRAEVFNNNVILIWGGDQRMLARPLLANTQDTTTFADLVLAFAQRVRSSTR